MDSKIIKDIKNTFDLYGYKYEGIEQFSIFNYSISFSYFVGKEKKGHKFNFSGFPKDLPKYVDLIAKEWTRQNHIQNLKIKRN